MPICPHCETRAEELLAPCPTGDGFFCIEEREFAAFRGDKMLGRNISDRYVVTGVIGRGAIGRVYKAHQLGVEREVVLKIFKLEKLLDDQLGFQPGETLIKAREDARQRFIREARVLGQLTHPNCVTIYDFGVSDDGALLYIAMEFVAGVSLREALNRGLRAEAVLDIMKQVLGALREAHALDIVHRDLKPENIIVSFRKDSHEPVAKVLDFGIAKLVGHNTMDNALTSAGMLFGTPSYMSPEQCRGATDEVGAPSDIYAFGCMAYELVCGRLPFEGRTPQQLILMHQDEPVPDVVLRDGLEMPQGVEAFIQKCLAKQPAERYPSAREALKILDRLIEAWDRPVAGGEDDTRDEIRALREASRAQREASSPSKGSSPRGATFSTITGQGAEELASERAELAQRQLPADGRTVVSPPSDNPERRVPLQVQLLVGGALAVVLIFCVLLFVFFYRFI